MLNVRVYDEDGNIVPEPVPFPGASRAARLRVLNGAARTIYRDDVAHFDPLALVGPGEACSGQVEIAELSRVPYPIPWTSAKPYNSGQLRDLGNTKAIAFVELPSGTRYVVAWSQAGWLTVLESTAPGQWQEILEENYGGRDTIGLDVKPGEEPDELLVIYRAVRVLDGGVGAVQRWHLQQGAGGPTAFLDWQLLGGVDIDPDPARVEVMDCPLGVRYISEGSDDHGLLFVGDEAGHLWIFKADGDRDFDPGLLTDWNTRFKARSAAFPGGAGGNGFDYVHKAPSDRALYFSTGLATVRLDLDELSF